MTQPNELQRLNEDLAAGRLSPEDYRRRRDELALDVNGAAGRAAQEAPEEASPFPPAFRWETSSSEGATQVMQAVGRDAGGAGPADATQVVRTGDVHAWERTQVDAPNPGYQPHSGHQPHSGYQASPSYQQRPDEVRDLFQPAGSHPESSAPPWASADPPPIAEAQSTWMRQGPEVFEAPAMQARSKQIVGIAVLAVLVAGLVGAGVAYVLTAGSPSQPGQAGGAQFPLPQLVPPPPAVAAELPDPPPPRPAPVDTSQALIEPPGESRGGGGLLDLPRLASTNLLPPPILNALRAGAMTDGVLKTTIVGDNTIGMYAFALRDERAATDVVRTIAIAQRDGGLVVDDTRAQQGLTVLGTAPGGAPATVYRAVYVLYNRAIFLEVFGLDRDSVLSTFDAVVSQQLTHAPPTVRTGR